MGLPSRNNSKVICANPGVSRVSALSGVKVALQLIMAFTRKALRARLDGILILHNSIVPSGVKAVGKGGVASALVSHANTLSIPENGAIIFPPRK
jgi:hypothetical protein